MDLTISYLPLIVDGLCPAEKGVDVYLVDAHVDGGRSEEGPKPKGPSLIGYALILRDNHFKLLTFNLIRLVVKVQRAAGKKIQRRHKAVLYIWCEED